MANANRSQDPVQFPLNKPSRKIPDAIPLDEDQVEQYNYDFLTLMGPDGEIVDLVGRHMRDTADSRDDARNVLRLLECLIANQPNGLELDEQATAGLADLLTHTQQLLD